MATTSSVVSDTSKFPFDPSLRKSTGNRLEYLYEISHVLEDSKIPITDLPIVNPYTIFNKPQFSFKKTIKIYIGPSHPSIVKEYFQASKFDQFNIPANDGENSITLPLPREFVSSWQKQGYTFHGRKSNEFFTMS